MSIDNHYLTNEGYTVSVITVHNSRRILVQFQDKHMYRCEVSLHNLIKGSIKNPYHPNTYDIGYLGVGPHVSWRNGSQDPIYRVWQRMFERCYSPARQLLQPAYIGCTVDSNWHNFQNFADWYVSNPDYGKGYELDKDILIPGNKVYSPNTCCLVPKEVNNLFREFNIPNKTPPGVTKCYNKFKVKFRNKHVGSYDTVNEAKIAYLSARKTYALDVLNKYKDEIQPHVFHSALANLNMQ